MLAFMTSPRIGLAEAARICGVSESTIRRRRSDLIDLGATRGAQGWEIPIPALISLGLLDRKTPAESAAPGEPSRESPVEPSMTAQALAEIEALKTALAAAELRAAVAETMAQERERIIRAQEVSLRMLEAPISAPLETEPQRSPEPRRRSWFFRHAR